MDLLEIYKNEQNLTIEDGKVIMLPMSQYEFTTYPLPQDRSGCIAVTKDEYFGLLLNRFMFNETLTGVVDYVAPVFEEIEEQGEEINEEV